MDEKNSTQQLDDEILKKHFRVAIFGSARISENDEQYQQVFKLAQMIGAKGFDIVTGGGPGLMEAANAGHQTGDVIDRADSIGLTIKLTTEERANMHLDLHQHFETFSKRLDRFMMLSNVVVVMPGGVGTCLELFYTWQLTQVRHICSMPIILFGDMWRKLVQWLEKGPVAAGLISKDDLSNIYVVKDSRETMNIINNCAEIFQHDQKNYCVNYKKYPLDR